MLAANNLETSGNGADIVITSMFSLDLKHWNIVNNRLLIRSKSSIETVATVGFNHFWLNAESSLYSFEPCGVVVPILKAQSV